MPAYQYQFPARALVSQEDAAFIENANIPRSRFINRWNRKTAFDQSYLVPIMVKEILPGDHMKLQVTAYVRMQTLLYPNMDQMRVDTFFFYVPNRVVWPNWTKMMGEQDTPGASINYQVPRVAVTNAIPMNTVYDHMNIPVAGQMQAAGHLVNALPLRMYNLIYNTWFRDENLAAAATISTSDANDTTSWYFLQRRAKSQDYFTSALPWPQKFTAPNVPILGTAPITGIGSINAAFPVVGASIKETGGAFVTYPFSQVTTAANSLYMRGSAAAAGTPEVFADLTQATGVSINQFRQAFMIQTLLERDARGGTRYIEQIRQQYGVVVPDYRLQRPEYIGGGSAPMLITPIAQTAPTAAPAGVIGALGGVATSGGSHRASYAAVEHGYVIGLINIKSETSYQQGLEKHWKRLTRYDWYVPALAQLGEQAIANYEMFATGNAVDFDTWGYQERWQEYRTKSSEVTGKMRSTATGTLDGWHLAEFFAGLPALNEAFIQENAPMARIFAAGGLNQNQQFLADIQYTLDIVRPIPTFGTPATLGRF